MIRNIFLPQKINNYYLFKKRVVSFTFSKDSVSALCITLYGHTKTINTVITEKILHDQYETADLALLNAIKKIINSIGSYTELIVVVNSDHAIFKELTIPLLDEEKISQVIKFELENYLPFPIDNALFDFIITNQNKTEQKSDVFTVSLQQDVINKYAQPFIELGIKIDTFCIDAFAVYDLFSIINTVIDEKAKLIVVSSELKTVTLYLEKNILKKIRVLDQSFDTNNSQNNNESWWQALKFTFESCSENWTGEKETVLLGNYSSEIINQASSQFINTYIHINTEKIITGLAINQSEGVVTETIPLAGLAASLNLPLTENFNLQKSKNTTDFSKNTIINYATITTLLIIIYGSLSLNAFFEIQKFKNASEQIKKNIIKDLKTALPSLKSNSAAESIRKAKTEITKEENIWFAFSSQTKHSFLTYLLELSTMIDRETLGLNLKKMTFNKNGIILDGNVRSFDAVEELIKQLKNTNLFTQVPNLQKTEFSMPLTFVNQEERS